MSNLKHIQAADPEIADAIKKEKKRQQNELVMIASENYAPEAVLDAQSTVLNNKYAEGYSGHRYYSGCEEVDVVESLAIERVRKLYGAEFANVQPHSGSQANMAVYFALLNPGDTVMGMSLAHGGHLTHGSPISFSGKLYRFIPYEVNRATETIDYDEVEGLAKKNRPKLIVCGASSYPRVIDFKAFSRIAASVGAILMADAAHTAGLIAARVHPSPVGIADVVTATTHKTLRGPRGAFVLAREQYGTRLDAAVFPGTQGGPAMHVIAAKAIAFKLAMEPEFAAYQKRVVENAKVLGDELTKLGLRLVSGGTDIHFVLVDLSNINVEGRVAEEALECVGICANKNVIPFDPRPPKITSGIRLGTPAVTTRGFGPEQMREVGQLIYRVLTTPGNEGVARQVKGRVRDLCAAFPIYK